MAADSLSRSRLNLASMDPVNEESVLNQILGRWQMSPGSAPGGSGLTGLGRHDAKGRSRQQNENVWALNALRRMQNKGPLQVESAPFQEIHQDATSGNISFGPEQFGGRPSLSALRNMRKR